MRPQAARYTEVIVRHQYRCGVYECPRCGFVFLEPVTWLAEAYASPINLGDIGYVGRNVAGSVFLRQLLRKVAARSDMFLDYGGGYGMLVRLMRDSGFRFHWLDPHCANLFAPCCEARPEAPREYRALTATEVFEHLLEPRAALADMLRFSDAILFTTELVPCRQPAPDVWRYFGLDHGQHVSFYTVQALSALATKAGLRYRQLQEGWHTLCSPSDKLLRWKAPNLAMLLERFRRRFDRLVVHREDNSLLQADAQKIAALIREFSPSAVPKAVNLDDMP